MYTIRTLLAHPVAAKAAYPYFYLSGISLAKARTQKKGRRCSPVDWPCEPRIGSCPYAHARLRPQAAGIARVSDKVYTNSKPIISHNSRKFVNGIKVLS